MHALAQTFARVLLLIALGVILGGCFKEEQEKLLVVKKSDIPLLIPGTGELASFQAIELGAPTIKYSWKQKLSFLIPEGTWVNKGEKVLGFDAQVQIGRLRDLQNRLATEQQRLQAQALNNEHEREQLKLNLAKAKTDWDKSKAKIQNVDHLIAQLDVDKLRLGERVDQKNYQMALFRQKNRLAQMVIDREIVLSEVQRLSAELNEQQKAIEAMEVKAPRDGIVVYKADHKGNKPAEGDQFTPIQKIVSLPDLNNLIVKTTIAEHKSFEVQPGDKVEIKFDAIPERIFGGTIKSLGKIVRVKSREEPRKVFDTIIQLDTPDPSIMRPGMAARLSIIQSVVADAVAIPEHAIIYRNNLAYLRVRAIWGESTRRVHIIERQEGNAIISKGLRTGDKVIL